MLQNIRKKKETKEFMNNLSLMNFTLISLISPYGSTCSRTSISLIIFGKCPSQRVLELTRNKKQMFCFVVIDLTNQQDDLLSMVVNLFDDVHVFPFLLNVMQLNLVDSLN